MKKENKESWESQRSNVQARKAVRQEGLSEEKVLNGVYVWDVRPNER